MIWLIILGVFLFIYLIVKNVSETNEKGKNRNNTRGMSSLQECISSDDILFRIDSASQELERLVDQSKNMVLEARRKGYITVETAWIDHFNRMVEVSNTLNQNLIYENQRRLQNDKFHRYTSLHFRSMMLGKFAYQDYVEAKTARDQIGELLVSIGKREVRVSQADKSNLYQIKDAFKASTTFLYNRMVEIEKQTAMLRDKIGSECGQRGRDWWGKIMRDRI